MLRGREACLLVFVQGRVHGCPEIYIHAATEAQVTAKEVTEAARPEAETTAVMATAEAVEAET